MYNRVFSNFCLVAKLPTSTKGAIPFNIRTCEFWKSSAELQKLYAEYISYISAISYFWVRFFTCYKFICSFQNTSFLPSHTYNTSKRLLTKNFIHLHSHSPRPAKEPTSEVSCNDTSSYPNTFHSNY